MIALPAFPRQKPWQKVIAATKTEYEFQCAFLARILGHAILGGEYKIDFFHWYSKGEIVDEDGIGQSKRGFSLYSFLVAYVCVTATMATRSSTDPSAIPIKTGTNLVASMSPYFHHLHRIKLCSRLFLSTMIKLRRLQE